ncbi:MAG: hypothetical protein WC618_05335, partial [Patescibacteria group bacterium]
ALGYIAEMDRLVERDKEANLLDRLEGEGFQAVRDVISGNILTPAQIVGEEATVITSKHQGKLVSEQVSGIYGAQAKQVLPMALSVFVNTLVSELLRQIFDPDKGLAPKKPVGAEGVADFYSSIARDNRKAAERAFSFFFSTVPATQLNTYDLISIFAACPESGTPGLDNCVMDTGLQRALIRVQSGEKITIQDAIDEPSGLLHGDWLLIPPTREADNQNVRDCYRNYYCFSNIQKLRKARILPVGFEMAALNSDPDQPWTLKKVVDNFENCKRNSKGEVIPDADYPYCHLIDPNWVLKIPKARCDADVIGPQLISPQSADRMRECADLSTCIAYNPDGSCQEFGYCTREKNSWDFFGQECLPHYATCKTYSNTADRSAASYLSRSVDYGACNFESVGCRAYSAEQTGGAWISGVESDISDYKKVGRNQTLYFNKKIIDSSCDASVDGCSMFYQATDVFRLAPTYLKKAPDYLGCYDRVPATPATEWPRTEAELNNVSADPKCADFAGVCVPSEVGCEAYTPIRGGAAIPGVVGENQCNRQCVGYDVYKQLESPFEPAKDLLYFIPDNAAACSPNYHGCSEFTNIDESVRGGEGLEYYTNIKYCEKPEGEKRDNEKTFYTWEGSVSQGYVLRIHRLKFVDDEEARYMSRLFSGSTEVSNELRQGSPSYSDLSRAALQENYDGCNKANYLAMINSTSTPAGIEPAQADCREFYDNQGENYYRLLSDTVTISDLCHPLRKTEPVLEAVNFVDNQKEQCDFVKGLWEESAGRAGECRVCRSGGEYRDGECIYQAITGESLQCPKQANNCRVYAGNFAGNLQTVKSYDFEPNGISADPLAVAKEGWDALTAIMAEAVHVGGHSLRVVQNNANLELGPGLLRSSSDNEDIVYELSFWARGESQNLAIDFIQNGTNVGKFTFDPARDADTRVSVGDNWREYRLGPALFSGSETATATLRFHREPTVSGAGKPYFLDKVKLVRTAGVSAFIKDSWKQNVEYPTGSGQMSKANVPLGCDSNPTDSLPGEALGCRAYKAETSGDTVNATGFEKLCREKAVGCQSLIDTYNTVDAGATAYNVWCDNLNPRDRSCNVAVTGAVGSSLGACTAEKGQDGCFVDKIILPAGISIDAFVNGDFGNYVVSSTVVIPADTNSSGPVYLTKRNEFSCGDWQLGCQKIALEEETVAAYDGNAASFDFQETYLRNDPAQYQETLCRADLVGCAEFNSDAGISYFRDPKITGNKLCKYAEGLGGIMTAPKGWFIEGMGQCGGSGKLCQNQSECSSGEECENVGFAPCYPDYLERHTSFGLWSNDSDNYEGFAGVCPTDQNMCMEFIDPADTSQNPNGSAYYAIYDEQVKKNVSECRGLASLREGCVLFNKTEDPRALYNSLETYKESERAAQAINKGQASLVSPNTTASPFDSNIIVKVNRDRQCSEWLACKNSVTYKDESGQAHKLCYQYEACDESDGNSCTNFTSLDDPFSARLTPETYLKRDTSW